MSLHTLFETQVKIGISDADFKKGIAAAGTAVKDFALMGGRALADFAKDSISTGEQFDKSMAQVAATMGQTVDEITELRDFAKEMGSTTAFSASQAADALNYMALAGYDAATSMEMLPNVLNLAAAGGIELANASDMVTDAQSALGLSIEDTTALVDKMATTASKSNTSVAQLGQAILTVGGTAKNLKGGTTELATVLGILADNGIKGAEGGTALRNVMNSLIAPTESTQAVLDELGVAVFDAEGNIRSFNDIFLDLRNGMDKLTQQERMKAMSNLFNTRDMKSAEALIANVGDRYNELSGYIDNAAGSAEKMAETQLDTLAGDKTKFQSALEGMKLSVSDALTPMLREATQFGTKWISTITNSFNQRGVKGVTNSVKWMVKSGISQLGVAIPEITKTVFDEVIKPIGEGLLGVLPDWLSDDIKSIFGSVSDLIGNIDFDKLKDSLSDLGDSLEPLAEKLSGGVAWAFENVLKPFGEWVMNDALPLAMEVIGGVLDNISNTLDILAPLGEAAWNGFFKPLFSGIGELSEGTLMMLSHALSDIAETFKGFDTQGFIDDAINGNFFENWKVGIDDIVQSIDDFGEKVDEFFGVNSVTETWNRAWQIAGGVIYDASVVICDAFENIIEANKKLIDSITNFPSKWVDFWSGFGEYLASDKAERHMIDSNADGGYVSTPRLSWIAEKEPEYIIPESKMDKVFKGGGNTYNITVNMNGSGNTEEDAHNLAELSIQQIRAIGGTGY